MGWILTRKKSRQPKHPRKGHARKSRRGVRGYAAHAGSWDPRRTLLVLELFGILAIALGLVVAWRVSEQSLVEYAEAHQPPDTATAHIVLYDAPPWMTDPVRRQLAERIAKVIQPDVFDGASLRRAAEALAQDPWVRRVRQVRRLVDGRVIVEAQYREPVAVVEAQPGYILIDVQGVRLPGMYERQHVGTLRLPMITGIASAPPSQPGQTWKGDDIHAALTLVELLAAEPYVNQVRAFDVRATDQGRLRLALVTDQGEVQWGYPPGSEETIEPSWRVKVERLRRLYADYNTISAGRQVVEIYGAAVQGWGESASAEGVRADYTSIQ